MKVLTRLVLLVGFLASASGMADVISDGSYSSYKATWVESNGRSCQDVCRVDSMVGEHEPFESQNTEIKNAFVCKAKVHLGYAKGEAYGNNYQNEKYSAYCFVSTPESVVLHLEEFQCLCATD